jgi:hypothetical protein
MLSCSQKHTKYDVELRVKVSMKKIDGCGNDVWVRPSPYLSNSGSLFFAKKVCSARKINNCGSDGFCGEASSVARP